MLSSSLLEPSACLVFPDVTFPNTPEKASCGHVTDHQDQVYITPPPLSSPLTPKSDPSL